MYVLVHYTYYCYYRLESIIKGILMACLVLLEVIIDGVLQLPELFFLLHLFLFLISSQSRLNIVFLVIILLLFLQRQKGPGVGGRRQRDEWEGCCNETALLNTKPLLSAVGLVTAPTCHLPAWPHLVTSAFCSSMTTVATWLDFTFPVDAICCFLFFHYFCMLTR